MTNQLEGLTAAEWRHIAHKLWDILDDIDTLSDAMKPDQTPFYNAVMRYAMKRHEWLRSDGYTLQAIQGLEFPDPDAGPETSPHMVRNMSAPPDQGEIHVGIDLARHEAGLPPA